MRTKKKLGEMLIEAGLLTEEQLRKALEDHKVSGLKLGQFLIKQGVVSESVLVNLLSQQLKVDKYRPDTHTISLDVTKLIPAEMAQKDQVVPLSKNGSLLMVAMTDPMDIMSLDKIELVSNAEVEPVICTEQEFNHLFSCIYGAYSDLDGVLDAIEKVEYGIDADKVETTPDDLEVSSLQDMTEGAPVVPLVNTILSQAIREGASDVHISPEKNYVQLRFRVDGKLHDVPAPPKAMFLPIVSRIKVLADLDIASSRIPQDGRFSVKMQKKEINIRASTIPTIYGENVVLRLLDTGAAVYSLDRLGMSPGDRDKLETIITKPYGMILSTGPTGSGKTTSLYSILKKLNRPDMNIITLEDPVEYRVEKIRQVQLNRKAGMTFASGLRSILRQDPDVIMVGEIRDAETATIAVQAAMTGHRVLSTVHTNDAAGAIARFLDMGIEHFLVSSVMLVSFAQRLVRKICDYCVEPYKPPLDALAAWGLDRVEGANFQRGRGCFNCLDTGFKGRMGVYEVLVIDEMVQEMILKRNSAQEISRAAQRAGTLRTLKEDAASKVLEGMTTLEEAASAVMS